VAVQPRAIRPGRTGAQPLADAHAHAAYRSIALTLVVTFALSFGYLYHKQRAAERAVPAPTPQAVSVQSAPPLPSLAPPAMPPRTIVREEQPARPSALPRPAAPPAESTPAADQAGTELIPVTILMRREPRGAGIEGTAQNMSEDPMSVTLVSTTRAGDEIARTVLAIGPSEKKVFGTDEGMELHSGDKLVVHAQGYKDREAAVP
jgi:hypothetical protein